MLYAISLAIGSASSIAQIFVAVSATALIAIVS